MTIAFRTVSRINRSSKMSAKIRINYLLLLIQLCLLKSSIGGTIPHEGVEMANIEDFPYVAAILDDDLDEFLGLGVLVSRNVVFCEEIT